MIDRPKPLTSEERAKYTEDMRPTIKEAINLILKDGADLVMVIAIKKCFDDDAVAASNMVHLSENSKIPEEFIPQVLLEAIKDLVIELLLREESKDEAPTVN